MAESFSKHSNSQLQVKPSNGEAEQKQTPDECGTGIFSPSERNNAESGQTMAPDEENPVLQTINEDHISAENGEEAGIDCKVLLNQIKNGNFDAFDQVFSRYYGPLTSYARKYVQAEDLAQDISQETFLKLINRPPENLNKNDLGPWLFRVTRNLAIDKQRHRNFEVTCSENGIPEVSDEGDPLKLMMASANVAIVRKIITRLPDGLAQVVNMRIFQDIPFKDIALKLGIPVGTALWRMHHALTLLRQYWDEYAQNPQ